MTGATPELAAAREARKKAKPAKADAKPALDATTAKSVKDLILGKPKRTQADRDAARISRLARTAEAPEPMKSAAPVKQAVKAAKPLVAVSSTALPVQTTVQVQTITREFTEDEVVAILRAHVVTHLIPEHYRTVSRKPVPPELVDANVVEQVFHVPTIQDEYNEDGKFCLTLHFGKGAPPA